MNIKTRLILSVIFSTITIVSCQGVAATPKPVRQQTTQEFKLFSPDKKISILITLDDKISYSVAHNDTAILTPSPISMTIDKNIVLGATPNLLNTKSRTVNKKIKPIVPEKRKTIHVRQGADRLWFIYNLQVDLRLTASIHLTGNLAIILI